MANFASSNVSKLQASDGANLGTFAVDKPMGIAFDGANIWVTNQLTNSVVRLRAKDGKSPKSFAVGTNPTGLAFDGVYIWVANQGDTTVTKLQASNGANSGTFEVGYAPLAVAFDGANIWVTHNNTVSKTRTGKRAGGSG